MTGFYRPDQERSQRPPLVVAMGGVPGVDFGLEELGWAAAARIDPGQELLGLGELLGGEPPSRRGEGLDLGFGAQPGELLPDAEPVQDPSVRVAGEVGEALVEPGLDVEELLVDGRQHPAGHEQIAQVGNRPPVRQRLQRPMGQWDAPGGEVSEELGDLRAVQPVQAASRLGHTRERVEQRQQRRVDPAGASIEGTGFLKRLGPAAWVELCRDVPDPWLAISER